MRSRQTGHVGSSIRFGVGGARGLVVSGALSVDGDSVFVADCGLGMKGSLLMSG